MTDLEDPDRATAADATAPNPTGGIPDPVNPLQQPLEGWLTLADVVSEVSQEFAEFMLVVADLAMIVAQDAIPGLADSVASKLQISGEAYAGILNAIREHAFPLRPAVIAQQLAVAYSELPEEVTSVIEASPNGLADAAQAQFLATGRLADGDERFQDCVDRANELRQRPKVLLKASCSLEQPQFLGADVSPIYCANLAHSVVRDRISVAEFTYGQLLADSFKGKVFSTGPVGDPTTIDPKQKEGYRPTIDDLDVEYFWSTARPPINSWTYTIHLTAGTQFQRASTTAAKLLEDHRASISSEVHARVTSSSGDIDTVMAPILTAVGIGAAVVNPVMHVVVSLAAAAAAAVVTFIVDKVIKGLRGSNLTTWTIGHTVVTGTKWVPLSIFTVAHAGTPNLCCLTDNGGVPRVSDYPYDQDIWRKARFMLGETDDAATTFNSDYFNLVADDGRPVAWHDPQDTNGGFRILLPHVQTDSTAKYISAVRADIRYG
ncbi:hypothetical protein QDT91_23190 [Mycolicibacterium aubagnense]|uniref:hypothetical protein n=1 Tax=Mycolicibacterium aubagnense TaxID=319707 RepID=UPI00244DC83E|nr:hypothetical protein [Mycolicibacterium aubagnense]WGI32075.1 hypothetical protein QDT91_23190 [Mycolicibacterium aubagnense]